jgi:hypothetical protein
MTIKRLRGFGRDAMEWDPELLAKLRELRESRSQQS